MASEQGPRGLPPTNVKGAKTCIKGGRAAVTSNSTKEQLEQDGHFICLFSAKFIEGRFFSGPAQTMFKHSSH